MSATTRQIIGRRASANNLWLSHDGQSDSRCLESIQPQILPYEILPSEEEVGRAMFEEIESAAQNKDGDLVIILLGGRGAQALHRLLGRLAASNEKDWLLRRLRVFTQDALAPLRMDNGLSFVRDFERLLGENFFRKIKSFRPIRTDTENLEDELKNYIFELESVGGIDIFFLGLGPEANAASHLAYIKPGSGATVADVAGIIPISQSILEHHITKFKAGGANVHESDEAECRSAQKILTLGPAAILGAKRIVQSIVDARTAPAKRESYRELLSASISEDAITRAKQLDDNPGLWLRLHPNVRSLILPDVLEN
ncbi:MAG TPA: hypothetical protein VFH91_03090 [Pyrinomonadaceae bacterium]|nr:hypothetical protein [Pyrinomonadaceae bacterium]